MFELDAHVPLIIATPRQTKGTRVSGIAELLDLFPTLTELCGIPDPDGLAGTSLVPFLKNPNLVAKQFALTQTPRPNYPRGKLPVHMGYSIRTDELRYTEWRSFQTNRVVSRELYDHSRDPREMENIAGLQSESGKIEMLADHLEKLIESRR